MKDFKDCHERGGFWYSYGIHAQDWIPCEECEDDKCPFLPKAKTGAFEPYNAYITPEKETM